MTARILVVFEMTCVMNSFYFFRNLKIQKIKFPNFVDGNYKSTLRNFKVQVLRQNVAAEMPLVFEM